jgi:hypothetical protein
LIIVFIIGKILDIHIILEQKFSAYNIKWENRTEKAIERYLHDSLAKHLMVHSNHIPDIRSPEN